MLQEGAEVEAEAEREEDADEATVPGTQMSWRSSGTETPADGGEANTMSSPVLFPWWRHLGSTVDLTHSVLCIVTVGMTGAQIEKAKARRRGTAPKAYLSDDDHDYFTDLLQTLTVDRERIKEAMGFALDHAEAYEEVSPLSITCSTTVVVTIIGFVCVSGGGAAQGFIATGGFPASSEGSQTVCALRHSTQLWSSC